MGLIQFADRSRLSHSMTLAETVASPDWSGSDRCKERQLATLMARLRWAILRPPATGERFHAIFLDHRASIVGDSPVIIGKTGTLSLKMRDLFTHALSADAKGMILAHNHPSGDCRPSEKDINATRRISEVANALDIALIDHLIFTNTAVFSMRAGDTL